MPTRPNLIDRVLLFSLNKGPAPILDLFGAASVEAVAIARKLGVFEALGDRDLSITEIATSLGTTEDGIRALLRFLEAQGYVTQNGGRYRNTRMTTTWLTTGSEMTIAPWLTFWNELVFPFWQEHLETAIREGEPPQTIYEWFDEDPTRWEVAQRGFRAVASTIVDEVTGKVDVPDGATSLLDVGGGHGLYAIDLCRAHPELTATVLDNPAALGAARSEIAAAGLDDRVSVCGGDYRTDDLGTGYDVAFVFNVIHAHTDEENRRLFDRIGAALEPGGRIAILDQLDGSARTPVGKTGISFVGLTYLTTLGAEIHPYSAVAEWVRSAGFEHVERSAIRRGGPGNTLVQATKPGA
ncbi:MAG: methyltransferase [Halobacteriales archaeon]|nr:methyltransferase [Halobacteriales archaeon]